MAVSASTPRSLNWDTAISAGSVQAGTAFSTQPVLNLTDVYGTGIASALITLELFTDASCSISAGTTGLTGNTATTVTNGQATFTVFKSTQVGVYYVKASAGSVSSSCSTVAMSVVSGAATAPTFNTPPLGPATAGFVFPTQPLVGIVDAHGNGISGAMVTLTAFTTNDCTTTPAVGIVQGGSQATASTGVATFAALKYLGVGSIYIKAESGGLSVCAAAAVVVSAGSAAQLSWHTALATESVSAGTAFTQPTVQISDANGNAIAGVSVTLALFTDYACTVAAGGASISGNVLNTNSLGRAPFTTFSSTTAGTYFVQASATGLVSSCSGLTGALTVLPAAASVLEYTQQPAGAVSAGLSFTTQPILRVKDAFGNPITGATVTLAANLASGCAGSVGSGTLGNAELSTSISGAASFSTLYYNAAETIFLKATSGKSIF